MKKLAKKEQNRTIMIIDDDPDILYSVKLGLEKSKKNYKVITFENGIEGIKMLKKIKPNAILLDIMMPIMNGWDVCGKIKSNKKTANIPILFLTAKVDPSSQIFGSLGTEDYITKPFSIKDVIMRIEKVIK